MNITIPLNISVEIGATALYVYVYCEDNMQSAINVFTSGLNVLWLFQYQVLYGLYRFTVRALSILQQVVHRTYHIHILQKTSYVHKHNVSLQHK